MDKEIKETKQDVELIEVPTQTELAYKVGEEVLNMPQIICRMANKIESIEKKL